METELTFEYLLQYFLIAHSKNFPKNFNFENKNVKITFLNYVASQLHLNVISSFYTRAERDIYQYNTAYNFLKGAKRGRKDTLKVLSYLFQDTYMYLMKTPDVYKIRLEFDQNTLGIELHDRPASEIKDKLIRFLKTALDSNESENQLPEEWQCFPILQDSDFLELANDKAFEKFMELLATEQIEIKDVIERLDNYVQAIHFMYLENEVQFFIGEQV